MWRGPASHEVGHPYSKALKYFGLKLHSVVSLTGVVMGFLLTPAGRYDNQPVVELLDSFSHHLKRLLGDGAYNDAALQTFLEQYRSLELLAPVKVNQPPIRSKQAQQQLNRLRLICETVNAQGPRAIALVQTLCQKYLGTADQNSCQAHCSQCGDDGQPAAGKASITIG